MKILLTGASGFIGRHLAAASIAAGHQIQPVSRRHGIDFSTLLTPQSWLPHLDGVEAVINCVGIIGETRRQRFDLLHRQAPSALFQACSRTGLRRVIQISALGADETAFSAYHLSKRAADKCLRNLDLDWFVLRPSLIYGPGGKSTALFMRLAALPLIPVIGAGRQKLQPVYIGDVVEAVLKCLISAPARLTLDLAGSETYTFAEWLQTLRRAQGLPPARLLRIPLPIAKAGMIAGACFNPVFRLENLRMLQKGYAADAHAFIQFLGRMPRTAEPSLFFSDVAGRALAGEPS